VELNCRSFGILMVIISLLVTSSALLFGSLGPLPASPGSAADPLPSLSVEEDTLKTTASSRSNLPVGIKDDASGPLPETISPQDAPDVKGYDSWRTVNPEDVGSAERKECTRPQCKWLSKLISAKLDWTIKPCHDFYSHVCSAKWFGSSEEPFEKVNFRSQNVAMLMHALNAYIKGKTSANPWQRNAATFYKECLNLKADRTLSGLKPRFPMWPLTKLTSDSTLARLSSYCKRYFRVDPLLVSYLSDVGGHLENFTRYVTSPILPRARFQLLYPNAREEDYLALIRSLLPGKDGERIAREILKLEMALGRITSREFVSLADRILRVPHLTTGSTVWDLLLQALTDGRREVRTLDFTYASNLMAVLRDTSSPLDTANFIIYSALLHLSPLLQNMSSLVPLGMDETVRGVPTHVQGCLRLTEKAYERGMRILALMALGAKDWSPEKPKATAMLSLISDLKQSLSKYVGVWYADKQSRKLALRRLRTLKVNLLGATPHDDVVYARDERPHEDTQDILSFLEDSATRDIPKGSFFPGSAFSPEPKYVGETHTLYLPPAFFGLVNNRTDVADPLFLPVIGAPILRAIMAVVDARGAQIFTDKSGTATHWWSAAEDFKSTAKVDCFRNLYSLALKQLLISTSQQVFHEEFVAQGAILEPLHRVFKKRVAQYYPNSLRIGPDFTADMIFFIVYAMGFCEMPGSERYKIMHRVGIPSRILVNGHLGSNERFVRTFGCKRTDEMVPLRPCSYWK
ncbi:unnamed protein product, partial [Ixodes hexagonus]